MTVRGKSWPLVAEHAFVECAEEWVQVAGEARAEGERRTLGDEANADCIVGGDTAVPLTADQSAEPHSPKRARLQGGHDVSGAHLSEGGATGEIVPCTPSGGEAGGEAGGSTECDAAMTGALVPMSGLTLIGATAEAEPLLVKAQKAQKRKANGDLEAALQGYRRAAELFIRSQLDAEVPMLSGL